MNNLFRTVIDLVFSKDMLQNILAELFGIVLTVALIDRLLDWRQQKRERAKWLLTRQRVGSQVGWAHTLLKDKLQETGTNGYELVYNWCQDVLQTIKNIKQQYAYAFTAEMASRLEEYEQEISQIAYSTQLRQWRNLEVLNMTNGTALDFMKVCGVSPNDVEHLFIWSKSDVTSIVNRLKVSSLDNASLPEPSPYFRW